MLPNAYYLLRLVREAGEVVGRKRLQKLVFLLENEGMPTDLEYLFHYYGPYSPSLASETEALATMEWLNEEPQSIGPDAVQYRYTITDEGRRQVDEFSEEPQFEQAVSASAQYAVRFSQLAHENSRILELAATVVYWRQKGYGDEEAVTKTSRLKAAPMEEPEFEQAIGIARDSWQRRLQNA
jgi:uncharacterized protein